MVFAILSFKVYVIAESIVSHVQNLPSVPFSKDYVRMLQLSSFGVDIGILIGLWYISTKRVVTGN